MKKNFQFFPQIAGSRLGGTIFNLKNFLMALILTIAAVLRLYRIQDYMTFLGDEGRDVLKAYDILHGHLTLLGPTSSVGGFFLGPIYYYFMAPFLWIFNYNPIGPAVMVALFGIATVWLLYRVCSDLFNPKVGLIASFLYAISPLVIAYSRSSWNPNPLPFFSLLTLYTLYKGVSNNKLKFFFASGVLLGITMQLHYLATFLGVIILSYILLINLLRNSKHITQSLVKTIKDYFYIFIGFVIGWSPFFAFEIRHGFLDFKNIFNFIFFSKDTGVGLNYFQTVYDVFFRLFGRLVFVFPPPEQFYKYPKPIIELWTILILLIAGFSSFFLLQSLYKSFKEKNDDLKKYLLIVVWGFLGVMLFGFYKKAIYEYYFAFMFPVPFILVGNFIYEIKNLAKNNILIIFSGVIILSIALINLQGIAFRYEPNKQLNQMKTIANFVMVRTDAKPFNFALITGSNSDYAYRYFFTIWDNPPVTIENAVKDPQRKTATDQLFVVCESLPCQPLGNSLWEIAGFGQADIANHWSVSVVEVYKLVHHKGK